MRWSTLCSGPYTTSRGRFWHRGLLRLFGPGMVVLADRGFSASPCGTRGPSRRADLLWRTKSTHASSLDRP